MPAVSVHCSGSRRKDASAEVETLTGIGGGLCGQSQLEDDLKEAV